MALRVSLLLGPGVLELENSKTFAFVRSIMNSIEERTYNLHALACREGDVWGRETIQIPADNRVAPSNSITMRERKKNPSASVSC